MSRSTSSRRARWFAASTAGAVLLGTASLTIPQSASAAPAPDLELLRTGPAALLEDEAVEPSRVMDQGRSAFLLELETRSTGQAFRAAKAKGRAAAVSSARTQLDRVRTAQSSVIRKLPARTPVIYRTHAALAAIAVESAVANQGELERIPGVAKVWPITPKQRDNSYAVGLQGGPAAWQGNGALGADITIGVVDSGIDFTHLTFGGSGDYATEHAIADSGNLAGSTFPTAKVIGGYDLAGDAYTGKNTAVPDPNPLDCRLNGHGTHVAGIAAGQGVTAAGATYDGPYDGLTTSDLRSMRIGPGMAPQARLMAFRVFGCEGSTLLAGLGVDHALDPNRDGSTADAVDVLNLSLGSAYGTPDDGDSRYADAAVNQGVSVVISAGNEGDLYDVGGSPGAARRALTVASSVDASAVFDALDVTYPGGGTDLLVASRSADYDWATKPDLEGEIVVPPTNTDGCTDFTGADATAVNGRIALLTWNSASPGCGSKDRGDRVAAAGGVGYILAETSASFTTSISGSKLVPGVLVTSTVGAAIRAELTGGAVEVDGTEAGGIELEDPNADDRVSSFSSRGFHGNGNLKPDVAAVGESVFSAAAGTNDQGMNIGGTSMAAPMVAGLAALVRSAHPTWTPEQVKANIMNTAGQDLDTNGSATSGGAQYAPNRVGSGRIEADQAIANDVLAYVTDDPGAVSVSFGPVEVSEAMTLSKTVRVQNTGAVARVFTTAYDEITSVPGVTYDVAPATVAVPAGESVEVTVTFRVDDPTVLTKTVDPTHSTLFGSYRGGFLADASGNLVLTPTSGDAELRVPVYSAPRPASVMTQPDTLVLEDDEAVLRLEGQQVAQGTGIARVESLTVGLELQAVSAPARSCGAGVTTLCVSGPTDRGADLEYVGTTSTAPYYATPVDGRAYFGIATHGARATGAGPTEFDVYLDTDRDGHAELVAFTTRLTDTDVFVVALADLASGDIVGNLQLTNNFFGDADTALFDSDVVLLPVSLADLVPYGVDAASPRIDYGVTTFGTRLVEQVGMTGSVLDGTLSANLYAPGVWTWGTGRPGGANTTYGPVVYDRDAVNLNVVRNPASYTQDRGKGLLMLHFHNKVGDKAQVVDIGVESTTELTAPPSATAGRAAALTVTVDDPAGASHPTGTVEVRDAATDAVVASGPLADGAATLTFTPSAAGTQNLVATYSGDTTYLPSTSSAQTLAVSPAPPTPAAATTLSLSRTSVPVGGTVDVAVAVAGNVGTPTGAVSVRDADSRAVLASGTLADGAATLQVTPTSAGTMRLVASYAGDSTYPAADSAAATLTVTQVERAVTISASATSVVRGEEVRLTVGIERSADDPVPTGTVSVVHETTGATVASGALGAGGSVVLPLTTRDPGTMRLRATYSGDEAYAPSGPSAAVEVTVTKAKPKPTIKLSAKRGKVKKKVTVQATVPTIAGIPATGSIVLKAGKKTLATARIVDGAATLTFKPKKTGKLNLRVVYDGDATYKKGRSEAVTYTVVPRGKKR